MKIFFVKTDETRVELSVLPGISAMEAARLNNVNGIEAQCGGNAICGTCHIYVDESFMTKLAPVETQEDQILDCVAAERRANSRLSCQIPLTDQLDGLVLRLPDRQV